MKKFMIPTMLLVSISIILSSCRPPDLEGAFVHYNAKRYDQALELAKKVTVEHPQNHEGWYLLGMLYSERGDIPAMLEAFNQSESINTQFKTAIDNEKKVLYGERFNSGVKKYNSYFGMEDRNSDEAKELLTASTEDFKYSNILNPNYRSASLEAQGYTLGNKQEEAKQAYKMLTENYADSAQAWVDYGRYFHHEKEYDKAIENFEKAVSIDPEHTEALSFLAQTYDLQDMTDKAEPIYRRALALNDEDAGMNFNLGFLLYKDATKSGSVDAANKDKLQESVNFFNRSVELDGSFKSVYILKGNAELLLEKFDEAIVTLEKGIERYPDEGQLWGYLSVAYAKLGMEDKANEANNRYEELQ